MPKLTKDLFAVPDGEIYPVMFKAGEEVTGGVARAAMKRGILEPEKRPMNTKARKAAPENK